MLFEPPGALYHPNVNQTTGEICAGTIEKHFSPTKNVTDLGKMVLEFLSIPNLESPLDVDIASEMTTPEKLVEYEAKAHRAAERVPRA
jgi:ubiquitin-protein ligase